MMSNTTEISNPEGNPNPELELIASRIKPFFTQLERESDRACVILAAANLDDQLYNLIKAKLVPYAGAEDDLLDGDRPLSTFSSRITMAYRLGLIDSAFCRHLNLIRKIRNEYAHSSGTVSLEGGSVASRIHELERPLRLLELYSTIDSSFTVSSGHKKCFLKVVAYLTAHLEFSLLNIQHLDIVHSLKLVE
jgi:DNA-binding MltR family transcriptional regulator